MGWETFADWASYLLFAASGFFFLAGSVGLVRFPDVYTRLHALTKSDNLGLGLTSAGLALQSGSLIVAAKLLLIWVIVIITGATACHLIAHSARASGVEPWTGGER
jgi:multicomponent Na+:H+ antiporter subunit G